MSIEYPIPRQLRQALLTASAGQSVFTGFDFLLFAAADLRVLTKAPGAPDWTVLDPSAYAATPAAPFAAFPAPFVLTLTSGQTLGTSVWVQGSRLHERLLDVTQGGAISSVAIEGELDRQSVVLQEVRRDVNALGPSTAAAVAIDAATAHADRLAADADAAATAGDRTAVHSDRIAADADAASAAASYANSLIWDHIEKTGTAVTAAPTDSGKAVDCPGADPASTDPITYTIAETMPDKSSGAVAQTGNGNVTIAVSGAATLIAPIAPTTRFKGDHLVWRVENADGNTAIVYGPSGQPTVEEIAAAVRRNARLNQVDNDLSPITALSEDNIDEYRNFPTSVSITAPDTIRADFFTIFNPAYNEAVTLNCSGGATISYLGSSVTSLVISERASIVVTQNLTGSAAVYEVTISTPGVPGATGPAPLTALSAWLTATPYVVGPPASYVSHGGSSYVCLVSHTSGTFATDLAALKWGLVASKGDAGAGIQAYVPKTANYTITTADHTVDCTANSFTLTLPTAVGIADQEFIMKNTGSGTITINTTSAQTIDGNASGTLTVTADSSMTVRSTGANWIIT